jgi:hypothetical protein
MSNSTQYSGSRSNTDRRWSDFWADCRWGDLANGQMPGTVFFEDFLTGGKITSPTTEAALVGLPYNGFSDDAIAGTPPALITSGIGYDYTKNSGGALILANTTANHQTLIRSTQTPYQITANGGAMWFEARVKPLLIATQEMGFFVGLIDSTIATSTAVIVSSTGTPATTINYVGFHKPVANTTTFNANYQADTVTPVTVNSGIGALVAATYVKLGMKFEPRKGNRLTFFVDGVKQSTTYTVPDNTGTDFPADTALGWMIGMCGGSGGSDNYLAIDWIRIAQEMAN